MAEFPTKMVMSTTVIAEIGFKDSRLQLGVKMGRFLPPVKLSLTAEDLPAVEKVIAEWKKWMAMSAQERAVLGAD